MAITPYGVVVVPGLGGTTLTYGGGKGGTTKYWYNPTIMASRNPLSMALAADGVSPIRAGASTLSGRAGRYGHLRAPITALANAGKNPVFWGYDCA